MNPSFNNDIFLDGQAIAVDANMENGGHGNTGSTLSFSTDSSDSSLQFQWQWGNANRAHQSHPEHENALDFMVAPDRSQLIWTAVEPGFKMTPKISVCKASSP